MKKSVDNLALRIKSLNQPTEWFEIAADILSEEVIEALRSCTFILGLRFTKLLDYYIDKLIDLLRDNAYIRKVEISKKRYPIQNPTNGYDKSLNELLLENQNLPNMISESNDNSDELIIASGKLLSIENFRQRMRQARQPNWNIVKPLSNFQMRALETLLAENLYVQNLKIQGASIDRKKSTLYPHIAFNINLLEITRGQVKTLVVGQALSAEKKQAALKLISENRVTEVVMQALDWDFLNELPKQSALTTLVFATLPENDQPLDKIMHDNISINMLFVCNSHSADNRTELVKYYSYRPMPNSILYFNTNKFIADCSRLNPIKLNLSNAILTPDKTNVICEKLNNVNSLIFLKMTSVTYSQHDAMLAILTSLYQNPRIQLRGLSLTNVVLSDEAFTALLLLVENKPSFTRLSLNNIKMDKTKVNQLKALLTRNVPLSHLDLSQTQLNNELIHDLCVALESNSKLASLTLSQNPFDMTGIASLKRLLLQNRFIRSINLQLSCLTGADAKQFVMDIKKTNCSLTDLVLSHAIEKVNTTVTDERGAKTIKTVAYYKKFQDTIDSFTSSNGQKRDQLFDFVRRGETANAEKALSQRLSPNCCDSEGNTPLYIALQAKPIKIDMVRLLVSQGAHPRIMNKVGRTPLDSLDAAAQADIIDILMGNSVSDKKKPSNQARSITSYFSQKEDSARKRERDASQVQPSPESAEKQVKIEDEIASPVNIDENLIYVALSNDAVHIISQAVNSQNCHLQFRDGSQLLHIATRHQAQKCVEYLLQTGADASRANALNQLPIHLACLSLSNESGLRIVELLISAFPQSANSVDQFGLTPLYCLAGGFSEQIAVQASDWLRALAAKKLLEHQADLQQLIFDYQSQEKMTVLHKAVARRCYRLTKVLLTHSTCNAALQDGHGWSPLHHAVFRGDLTIIARLMIHPHIRLDQPDQSGRTPRQLARSMEFAADVRNPEMLRDQIDQLFEQRSKQKFPQLNSGIYWAKELTIRFGSRHNRNHDLLLPFEAEHSRLQNMAGASRAQNGNYLTASLSFIISKGKHQSVEKCPRTHITIKLVFTDKFHVTHAWESREQIERTNGFSVIKKVERSPDALARIINRLNSAPVDVRQNASNNIADWKSHLSEVGIKTLYYMPDFEVGDYDFEQRFHHSEQGLFDHLQDPELIEQILTTLQESSDFQIGCKVYAVILNAFSKCYMCPDCMASTLGFQNTKQGEFFKILKDKLKQRQCVLPQTGDLKSITLFSANVPTKYQQKTTADQHIAYDPIDLRTVNNNLILSQDATECKPKGTTYHSRK